MPDIVPRFGVMSLDELKSALSPEQYPPRPAQAARVAILAGVIGDSIGTGRIGAGQASEGNTTVEQAERRIFGHNQFFGAIQAYNDGLSELYVPETGTEGKAQERWRLGVNDVLNVLVQFRGDPLVAAIKASPDSPADIAAQIHKDALAWFDRLRELHDKRTRAKIGGIGRK